MSKNSYRSFTKCNMPSTSLHFHFSNSSQTLYAATSYTTCKKRPPRFRFRSSDNLLYPFACSSDPELGDRSRAIPTTFSAFLVSLMGYKNRNPPPAPLAKSGGELGCPSFRMITSKLVQASLATVVHSGTSQTYLFGRKHQRILFPPDIGTYFPPNPALMEELPPFRSLRQSPGFSNTEPPYTT